MYDMRSPDGRPGFRPGRAFEEELNLRYLSPGAFTVLSPEESGSPPEPSPAPQQFRLSPNARRSKNQSFAIIAEPANYEPSRSPSPSSGRVSPFRGRGFNPTGSRHASPAPSPPPPPEDNRVTFRQNNNNNNNNNSNNSNSRKRSHIPQLTRRNSSVMLSTEESSDSSPKHQRRNSLLKPQLSRSLNNIAARNANKPPPAPGNRRIGAYSRNSSFSRLSPIIGSSPEPSSDSKSQSSPSRIPKSKSSPSSRKHSPSRSPDYRGSSGNLAINSNAGRSRAASRTVSRNGNTASRSTSRNASPSGGKPPISPTKKPSYRNVQAKVNSFNAKSTTKVPNNNNNVSNINSNNSNSRNKLNQNPTSNLKKASSNSKLNRTDSVSASTAHPVSRTKKTTTASNNTNTSKSASVNNNNNNQQSPDKKQLRKTPSTRNLTTKETPAKKGTETDSSTGTTGTTSSGTTTTTTTKEEPTPKLTDLLLPSATTVVSSTTEAVTKPLKIEAPLDTPTLKRPERTIKETPMYMDEDSERLLKQDHNKLSPLSPAATAIISLSNQEQSGPNQHKGQMPNVETTTRPMAAMTGNANGHNNGHNNGQNHQAVLNSNAATVKVTNSNGGVHVGVGGAGGEYMNKLISPDDTFGARVHYEHSPSDVRTVLPQVPQTHEVRPIKIMVQEKGDNMEVQSGNVRFPPNATNGTAQGAGAPPHTTDEEHPSDEAPKSRCGNFMNKFKQKMCCCCNNKKKQVDETIEEAETAEKGCFACLKRGNKKAHDVEEIIISHADDVEAAKKTFFQKLNCCKSNKVGDSTGFCGFGKKKDKLDWTQRRDSILSEPVPPTTRERCKNFFKALFCCGCACRCCKRSTPAKIDDAASRRASLLSKKKSLTPTVIPQEDPKNKLDTSLVEYTSTMKAAIPVLPIWLAYFCLFFNIFAPGTGTVFSGMFCLCMGKPRFSQKDGPKPRVGSFIINTIIGVGQLFTVLFCCVGWGWSIWWGVIMIKLAKKYKKIKLLEERLEAQQEKEARGSKEGSQSKRDVEKGRS